MRKILIIFFLILPSFTNAQYYLDGVFFNDYCSECKETIHFNKDGTFKYSFADDLANIEFGEGNYNLFDDELVLYFGEVRSQFFNKTIISEGLIIVDSSIASDTVFYRAKIIDRGENFPLKDAIVIVLDSISQNVFPPNSLIYSNELGFIEFSVSRNIYPIILKFSYIGYNDLFFKPEYSINYVLICKMEDEIPYSYTFIPPGSVRKFHYEENTDTGFYLKEKGMSRWFPYIKKK